MYPHRHTFIPRPARPGPPPGAALRGARRCGPAKTMAWLILLTIIDIIITIITIITITVFIIVFTTAIILRAVGPRAHRGRCGARRRLVKHRGIGASGLEPERKWLRPNNSTDKCIHVCVYIYIYIYICIGMYVCICGTHSLDDLANWYINE